MFEYDKGILLNYKTCVSNWVQAAKTDEDIDMSSVCKAELDHLNNYVRRSVKNYYEHTTPTVPEYKAEQSLPRVIYF